MLTDVEDGMSINDRVLMMVLVLSLVDFPPHDCLLEFRVRVPTPLPKEYLHNIYLLQYHSDTDKK